MRHRPRIASLIGVVAMALSTPAGRTETLLVAGHTSNNVLRFDASTATFTDTFIASGVGGLVNPHDMAIGPDGNLYVVLHYSGQVLRYDGHTGAFLGDFVIPGSGGLGHSHGCTFGPDGDLYIVDAGNSQILRFDGTTGAFVGVLVAWPFGNPDRITFGPDHALYVGDFGAGDDGAVLRFDGQAGTPLPAPGKAGATFVDGIGKVSPVLFGADGLLYVGVYFGGAVLRYAPNGQFVDTFVAAGSAGLLTAQDFEFAANHDLYIVDAEGNSVFHFSQSGAFVEVLTPPASSPLDVAVSLVFTEVRGSCCSKGTEGNDRDEDEDGDADDEDGSDGTGSPVCQVLSEAECVAQGGVFGGEGTDCVDPTVCAPGAGQQDEDSDDEDAPGRSAFGHRHHSGGRGGHKRSH
jgi:hypothetical protein